MQIDIAMRTTKADSLQPVIDRRGYCAIGLHNPKALVNIGCALRATGCYSATMVAVSGQRYSRCVIDTMKQWRHMPLLQVDNLRDVIPYDCISVAVDLIPSAKSFLNYCHLERAFHIFGPEDGTLGKEITSWCKDLVYVPTFHCMNLAM